MKELFENEDELLGLVRKHGLVKPSDEFTERVIQRIEETRLTINYQPLLSKKAWAFVISGLLLATVICWFVLSGNTSGSVLDLSGLLGSLSDYIKEFNFSFEFDESALLIITLAIISMGILLSIDLWFSNNRRGNTI
jgi:hypothetical protein